MPELITGVWLLFLVSPVVGDECNLPEGANIILSIYETEESCNHAKVALEVGILAADAAECQFIPSKVGP